MKVAKQQVGARHPTRCSEGRWSPKGVSQQKKAQWRRNSRPHAGSGSWHEWQGALDLPQMRRGKLTLRGIIGAAVISVPLLVGGLGCKANVLQGATEQSNERRSAYTAIINEEGASSLQDKNKKQRKERMGARAKHYMDRTVYRAGLYLTRNTFTKLAPYLVFCTSITFMGGVLYGTVSGRSWNESMLKSFYLLNNCPGSDCTDEDSPWALFVANTLYIIGLLTFAVLLGIVAEGVQSGVAAVRGDNSSVYESNHAVVLNWNSKSTMPLLNQLALQGRGGKWGEPGGGGGGGGGGQENVNWRKRIEKRDKETMDADIETGMDREILKKSGMQIVVRQGSPYFPDDLKKASVETSKTIYVLAPDPQEETAKSKQSAYAEKAVTLLGLTYLPDKNRIKKDVVVQLLTDDPSYYNVDDCESCFSSFSRIQAWKALNDILAQSCVEPALPYVYESLLLSHEGLPDIYDIPMPKKLDGVTYGDAWRSIRKGNLLGYVRSGESILNPLADDVVLTAKDKLLVLTENPAEITFASPFHTEVNIDSQNDVPAEDEWKDRAPLKLCMIGWEHLGRTAMREVLRALPKGSTVTLICEEEPPQCDAKEMARSFGCFYNYVEGSGTDMKSLEKANVQNCDSVLLIPHPSSLGNEKGEANDTRTIACLMLLKKLLNGKEMPNVIGHAYDRGMAKMIEDVYGQKVFLLPDIETSLMVKTGQSAVVGSILAQLLDPVNGVEVDAATIGRWFDLPPGGTYRKFGEYIAHLRKEDKTAIGFVSGKKVFLGIDPETTVKVKPNDRLVFLTDLRN